MSYREVLKLTHKAVELCLNSYLKERETHINDSLFVAYQGAIMGALASNGKKPEYEPVRLTPKTEEELQREAEEKEKQLNVMYRLLQEELNKSEEIQNNILLNEAGVNNG